MTKNREGLREYFIGGRSNATADQWLQDYDIINDTINGEEGKSTFMRLNLYESTVTSLNIYHLKRNGLGGLE